MADAPSHIGPFEVRERLGTGGMGVVYLAYDPPLDRLVAVKVLNVDDEEIRQRFLREARFAARVQHPNIVAIYAVGQHEGRPYMAMEYIAGDTLASIIRSDQPVAMGRRVQWLYELANGLEFAHRNGIVHRDVKPANLIVSRDSGLLRLLDFGIARDDDSDHTMAGHVIGTPSYMSPEQVTGGTVDARSDIFAFGLVAYELLCGTRAFQGANTYETTRLIVEGEPVPLATRCPELPSPLVTMVHHCLAKSPQDRPASLVSVRADLKRVLHRLDPVDEPSIVRTVIRPAATATLTPTTSTGDRQRRQQRRRQQIQSLVSRARDALGAGDLDAAIEAAEQADLFDDRTPELSLLLQDIHAERTRRDVEARLEKVRAHIDQGDASGAELALSAIAPEVAPDDVPTLREAIARMRLQQRVDRCARDLQALLGSRDPEAAERRLAAESAEVRAHPRIEDLRRIVETRRAEIEAETRRREEEARRAEARRREEEEARRAEAQRLAEEAEARRREEDAARRREEAEAQRLAEEARRAEAQRLAEEAEARRREEEAEARRQEEEARRAEARRREEEEARRAEAQRLAEEAEARRREEDAARRREEEAARRRKEEAEARRRAEEAEAAEARRAEAQRLAEEADARRREEEARRAEARRLEEEEAEARRREEEAARRAEARRLEEEEAEARRREEAEAQRRAEEARRAEARRLAEEADARRREEARRAEEERLAAEADARRREEAEARRREEEADARRREEADARRRAETTVVATDTLVRPTPAPPGATPTTPETPAAPRPGLPMPALAAGAVALLLAGLGTYLIFGGSAERPVDADPPAAVAVDAGGDTGDTAAPPSNPDAEDAPPTDTTGPAPADEDASNVAVPTGAPILAEVRRLSDSGRFDEAATRWRRASDAPDRDAALSYLLGRAARATGEAKSAAEARGAGSSPAYQDGRNAEARGAALAARRSVEATEQFRLASNAYGRATAPTAAPASSTAPPEDPRPVPPSTTGVPTTVVSGNQLPGATTATTGTPPLPSPPAAEDQRPAVLAALDAFAAAYNTRDVGAVAATWPGMPAEWRNSLAQSFRTFSSVDWAFTSRTATVNGDTAQVLAAVTIRRTGSRGSPTSNQRYRFDLRRNAGSWVIQSVTLQ